MKSDTGIALNSRIFSKTLYVLLYFGIVIFESILLISIRLIKIKAVRENIVAAVKHPFDPKSSYKNPPIYGPIPTANVVLIIKYPNASPKRFLGIIAVAIVIIALADPPNPIP